MNDNGNSAEKLGLPPYKEEFPPFPDVEPEFNFYENKEEIYRRNIELAKEMNERYAAEEARRIAAKKAEFEKMRIDADMKAYKDAQQKLAARQQNYPAPYHGGGLMNVIENFLSLFSPDRTVDLNKMSWQIVRVCAVIAGILFLMFSKR